MEDGVAYIALAVGVDYIEPGTGVGYGWLEQGGLPVLHRTN